MSICFLSIDKNRGAAAVKSAVDSKTNLSSSTECIIEALEIYVTNDNATFAGQNLIQTNRTAMETASSCSYSDLTQLNQ